MSAFPVLVDVVAVTDVGSKRTSNEDSYTAADLGGSVRLEADGQTLALATRAPGLLLAVADGMGGAAAGEVASALATEVLERQLRARAADDPAAALEAAVLEANRAVYQAAQARERAGMGSTLVAVVVRGGLAWIASVGDSRAYLLRRAEVLKATRDHSLSELLVEAGSLRREEMEQFEQRNVILQAIGLGPEVDPSLGVVELRREDVLLLCSDGLTAYVGPEEIRAALADSETLEQAARRLIELANMRGGADNITVAILRVAAGVSAPAPGEDVLRAYRSIRQTDLWQLARALEASGGS